MVEKRNWPGNKVLLLIDRAEISEVLSWWPFARYVKQPAQSDHSNASDTG
jgi:hypothetical protein